MACRSRQVGQLSRFGLYVHIPFCRKKCAYCDFVSLSEQGGLVNSYLKALGQELARHRKTPFATLYIGGGTPSLLSPNQFLDLFNLIRANIDVSRLTESTIESNPESLSREKLGVYRELGINRLSIGLQSTSNKFLSILGRVHSWEKFLESYRLAREAGFSNLNVDLIYGIPGQTLKDWRLSLKEVVDLEPEHISVYPLKIEAGTPYFLAGVKVDENLQADMYLSASEFLLREGFEHYEISNFCRPGYSCEHNLNYWDDGDFIGIGISAASHVSGRRWKNNRSLSEYIRILAEGGEVVEETSILNNEEFIKEKLMLNLRLKFGVSEKALSKWAGPEKEKFLRLGLAILENESFRLTPQGWLLSNQLFQCLV